jgi:hypothetical protein
LSTSTNPLIVHIVHPSIPYPSLQLADEEAGREQAHALGQNVLGHNVDERRQQDEGHGGLVDEEEGDKLGHGRLEDSLSHSVSGHFLYLPFGPLTICWGPTSVFLFWLAMRAGRAMADGRTAVGARKAALAKGRRRRAFMLGYLEVAGQRAAVEAQLAVWSLREDG